MNNRYFITAIDTDSGKTLVSAIFTMAFQANYWKPVQAGFPTDSDSLRELLPEQKDQILPEKYILKTPASPHAAAEIDNLSIEVKDFTLPVDNHNLIVEGAGGVLVPINSKETMIDLMTQFKLPVVLVSNLYLGSINHTLLSVQCLKSQGIQIAGIVFNGETNPASESVIEEMTGLQVLLRIPKLEAVNAKIIKKYANTLKDNMSKLMN